MSQPRRYELVFLPAAARAIRKLPRETQQQVKDVTEQLRDNPRPPAVTKLKGTTEDLWRVRFVSASSN